MPHESSKLVLTSEFKFPYLSRVKQVNLSISSVLAAMTYFSFIKVFGHTLNHILGSHVLYSTFHSLLVLPCTADGFLPVPNNHRASLRLRCRRCLVVRRLVVSLDIESLPAASRIRDQAKLGVPVGNVDVGPGCKCTSMLC